MGRKILFVTTDQQRYDALGCTGNTVARTPVVDRLGADGIVYHRAHNQNTVCTPARSTMITGQYVRTHGVVANGVPLPVDAPSVAEHLHDTVGYRTALVGKAHFQPAFDPDGKWIENCLATDRSTGPYRGFDHVELAMHGYLRRWHYDKWLEANGPQWLDAFYPLINFASMGLNDEGGGDTDAPEVKHNPMPRGHVPHRLGRGSHHRLAGLARPRRRLVLLDELPRPAPSLGPSGRRGAAPHRLAPARPTTRTPGIDRQGGGDPGPEAASLARLVRGALPEHGGRPHEVRAREHDPRPGPRGERAHPRRERAHRRGPGPGHGPHRRAGLGHRHRRRVHHRPRRAPR